MPDHPHRPVRAFGLVLVVASIGATILSLAGGTPIAGWSVALVAMFSVLVTRYGAALAAALSTAGFVVAQTGAMLLSPVLPVPSTTVDALLWGIAGGAGGAVLVAVPRVLARPSRRQLALAAAAATGPALLATTFAVVPLLPNAVRWAWGMNGDVVNVLLIARGMVADNGFDPVGNPQPTPLPFSLVAVAIGDVQGGSLLAEVARLQEAWLFAVALACVLFGATVAMFTDAAHRILGLFGVAFASLVGVSGFVAGVQFEFGFVSSALAVALLAAGWSAFLGAARHPVAAIGALLLLAIATLGTWSPLAIAMVALIGAIVALRAPIVARLATPVATVFAFAAAAALLAFALTITVPLAQAQSGFLVADGGFPPIGPESLLTIAAIALLAASAAARWSGLQLHAAGAVAMVLAAGAGVAILLILRRGAANLWGYYPAKFAWTFSIVLAVIAIGLVVAALARLPTRSVWDTGIRVAAFVILAAVLWSPASTKPIGQFPLAGIATGVAEAMPQSASTAVFALADAPSGPQLRWRFDETDDAVNSWLIPLNAPRGLDDPIRGFAYVVGGLTTDQLCEVSRAVPRLTVQTRDPAAEAEFDAACGAGTARFVLG